ncbi:unnamed protein product, partial [Musa banksii]
RHDRIEIITNNQGNRTTPPMSPSPTVTIATSNQVAMNPPNQHCLLDLFPVSTTMAIRGRSICFNVVSVTPFLPLGKMSWQNVHLFDDSTI